MSNHFWDRAGGKIVAWQSTPRTPAVKPLIATTCTSSPSHKAAFKHSAGAESPAPYFRAIAQDPDAADSGLTGKERCYRQQGPVADNETDRFRTRAQQRLAAREHDRMASDSRAAQVNPLAGSPLRSDGPF